MCDYSLMHVASRAAKVEDLLVTTKFPSSITRGFTAVGEPAMAVCLLPGTELSFEKRVEYDGVFPLWPRRRSAYRTAIFRQINKDQSTVHHDALEFPDGKIVLVTSLREGQRAIVLQLPADPTAKRDAVAEEATPYTRQLTPVR